MNGANSYHARNLKATLTVQGRKQSWLAQRCGVSKSMVTKLITGERYASQDLAERIATELGVPFFALFELHDRSGMAPQTEIHERSREVVAA